MNYRNHYYKFIEYRLAHPPAYQYFEKHHIIPKCVGGGDDDSNLVRVTAREHYILHHLLTKIYSKNYKLKYALEQMSITPRYFKPKPKPKRKYKKRKTKQINKGREILNEIKKHSNNLLNQQTTEIINNISSEIFEIDDTPTIIHKENNSDFVQIDDISVEELDDLISNILKNSN